MDTKPVSEQCKPNLASGRAEYIIWSMKCKAGVLMIPRKEWGVEGGREGGREEGGTVGCGVGVGSLETGVYSASLSLHPLHLMMLHNT